MGKKITGMADLFASAENERELVTFLIPYLIGYQIRGLGTTADEVDQLCIAINGYYDARREAREKRK